jgi:ribosomal protein S18 acetylase RimI-like enzyme
MKVFVTTKSKKWTDFEKEEWKKADLEHYGQLVNWDKKDFNILIKEGKNIIGSLRMDIRTGIVYIDSVIVSSEVRGKGIGKNLMDEVEKITKENKAHKIYLHTGKNGMQ